ncbi:MAG: hypothetical protein WC476_09180 [Phycisphaerae bacterium]|jgi:tetratricopeptide (TPR) repeat protein
MKSEHRHQLKTNELAEWIANFPQWTKENLRTIIYVSVLTIVVAGVYFWKVYEKRIVSDRQQQEITGYLSQISQSKTQILQSQMQGIDTAYVLIQAADNLQNFAQNTKDDRMAALAMIKRADALRTELHYRFGTVSRPDLEAQINRAKDSYTQAIEKSSTNPSSMAAAKLGLGLCEEELGNFEQARQIYGEITANADFESTIAAAQAEQRLLTMADYQQEVVFRPAPKRADIEPGQPQINIEPSEIPQEDMLEAPDLNLPGQ